MTSHHKIIELHEIAKCQGGKCLSDTYENSRTKLIWECSQGHRWEAASRNIKGGSWCHVCFGNKKHTIDDMHDIAKKRGGKCLSSTYVNSKTKLIWECSQGHQWKAASRKIMRGIWCPACAGNKKLSIDDMHYIAKERGGKCLSNTYTNNKTKLIWECSEGHQWKATPKNIKLGTWCPVCFFSRLSATHGKGNSIPVQL